LIINQTGFIMKKTLFTLLCLIALSTAFAQSTVRDMVVIEDATGTWCQYCPGAAMGCDDLLSNGKFVAVIANHNGDSYAQAYSNARNTMYGVSAFPSVGFDATKGYVGGSHTSSLYNTYVPIYASLITIPSPLSMSMDVTHSGLAYTAVVTVTKTDAITSTSNILYFFVTQSHISANWQGQNHLEHVNRLMVPDQNGTAVDFTSGDVQTYTLSFNLDAAWPVADCEFIAFVQDKDAGQGNQAGTSGYPLKKYVVYQTSKQGAINLNVDFTANHDTINPNDAVSFTNGTTGGYIGVPETFQWYFPGATPASSNDTNPVVVYPTAGSYDVTLVVNRGGQIDSVTKPGFIYVNHGVGVKEQSASQITVSPNPSNGTFRLTFNLGKSLVADLSITNISGTTVYSESNVTIGNDGSKTIELRGLPSGEYFLKVNSGDTKLIRKIVIN